MKIRHSLIKDIPRIVEIIEDAKELLASLKIDQWQNGYPNAEQVEQDILNGESYVVINNKNQITATSMFTINSEPTYKVIDGSWIIDESKVYGVIHRLAIAKEYRKQGIAQFIFTQFHQQLKSKNIQSLKIDTHQDNLGMQSFIKKLGYKYCGIIYTSYNAKRLAFEKVISE
ncbi:GNAT family N-acetyltransferase [uncultured Polaribacter sp.]|uniref:GNAT family N-acetyltransferase n=1 Tax=uncultured Polaribacter sp. TaxID=174711 RepID=UPI002609342E|nr:GNAT family N-acetyltransferase [uncultured Polaribacter sp.]